MKLEDLNRYSPALLRLAISAVFLWFGFSQIKNPDAWTGMIPNYVQSLIHLSSKTLVYLNGAFEITFAILLLLGLFTRFVSLVLSLHLLHIVTIIGYDPVGVRDFALALATLAIFLHGPDEFCLGGVRLKEKEEKRESTPNY
ncbi:MAG: DoxX family protein [Nanoarchaeota archaeon]